MINKSSKPSIAIVCDSLDQYGGAEKIVAAMHEAYPDAPIFTSVFNEEKMMKHGFDSKGKKIVVSKLGKQKWFQMFSKQLFFLYPIIFESFDFSAFDIVISSSTRFAHGIVTNADTIHVSYIHSPSRYAWDYAAYKKSLKLHPVLQLLYPGIVSRLRLWDRLAAERVDYFIANSSYTKKRVQKFYKKDSEILYPFVDLSRFVSQEKNDKGSYFLYVGRIIPLRKLELLIEVFNENGMSLHMVGNGERKYIDGLRNMAKANISFFEKQTDDQVAQAFMSSRALVWPGVEDFGIAPIEANAAGKAVIAYNGGGIKDSVEDGVTGVLYEQQTPDSLQGALDRFDKLVIDPEKCRVNADRFKKQRFLDTFTTYISHILNENSISA
jgi:glycosyltransferase involved in cell wall biosynthesis